MADAPLHSNAPEPNPGLDLFAAAWLERWQSFGGSVVINRKSGDFSLHMPMPGFGGRPEIEGDERQREWRDGFETGQWRELETLLRLVPGAGQALKNHVLSYPSFITDRTIGA